MEFETERLVLREFNEGDKNNLYKLFSEKFASTYEHLPKDPDGVESYINFHMENAKSSDRTHYYYVIELQETHEFVGSIGYAFVENAGINGVEGCVTELEYYLLEKHWNNGYMTEALKKIISSAFERGDMVKIFAQCHTDNHRSEKVMVKCGMRRSEKQPAPKFYNGTLKTNVRYELTV